MTEGDIWGTTMPAFSFSLGWRDAAVPTAEVRLWIEPEGGRRSIAWGEPWPGKGVPLPAAALLAALASALPVLGMGYVEGAPDDGEGPGTAVDIGAPLGLPGPVVAVAGRRLALRVGGRDLPFGSDGVGLLEAVLCLGHLCAARLSATVPDAARAWEGAAGRVDLFPCQPDIVPDGWKPPFGPLDEAGHWARKLGQDPAAYVRAATWVTARQWLHAADPAREEPSAADWAASDLPEGLPDGDAVAALAREAEVAAVGLGLDPGWSCMEEGLACRNSDARDVVHLARWPSVFRRD